MEGPERLEEGQSESATKISDDIASSERSPMSVSYSYATRGESEVALDTSLLTSAISQEPARPKLSPGYPEKKKRALLIASPFGRLEGSMNDVESFAQLLEEQDFDIMRCCGTSATRDNILRLWDNLILQLQEDNIVVIYYAGHGGLVESPSEAQNLSDDALRPRRYQFLVPMDFGDASGEFKGILDVEISILVRKTTLKTKNVTIILDCCHSGRMARDPLHGHNAIPRSLSSITHHDVSSHVERLEERGDLDILRYATLEGNQHAVRIIAAADTETAWEYDDEGQKVGAFTKALVPAIKDALANGRVSWKNVLMRVREQVNCEFPNQHPQAEGPYERLIFSERVKETSALPVVEDEDGEVVITAGRVAGIRERNTYVLMPHGSTEICERTKLGEATVESVTAFRAVLKVPSDFRSLRTSGEEGELVGALAFLKTEFPYQWPVAFSAELEPFKEPLATSKFIRPEEVQSEEDGGGDNKVVIAHICKEGNSICVYNSSHVKCASFEFQSIDQITDRVKDAVGYAEHFSRAEHLVALKAEPTELLEHELHITFNSASQKHEIPLDGSGEIEVGDGANLTLHNKGKDGIFVSVFDVNVAGRIFHLSRSSPEGIRLPADERYTLGQRQHTEEKPGLRMSWPKVLSDDVEGPIPESFVFIVTSKPVDLRHFAAKRQGRVRGDASQLERLAYHLSFAEGRDCDGEREICDIKWDMVRIPFSLR
ncbi:caspase domain-containing protein [Trichoderma sp. SZMC 28011]